ncbi:MAG: hypothetical protein U9O94_08395 [Nanoarchaeota archaeon]|nr:hypothetical protein [Nanoarchaeota archaeon]
MANKSTGLFWFLGAALVLVIFAGTPTGQDWIDGAVQKVVPASAEAPEGADGVATASGQVCTFDGTTLTIGPAEKAFAPTTSMSAEFHRLYIDGSGTDLGRDDGLKSDGATKAVTCGDKLTVVFGENSSTYYASILTFTVPDRSTFLASSKEVDTNNVAALYQMDASANMNAKFMNDDNGQLNEGTGGSGGNETIGVGEIVNIEASIQGTYEDAFSPYGRIIATVIYNTTAYDEVNLAASSGWNVAETNTPTFRSNANVTTGFGAKSYAFSKSAPVSGKTGIISNEKMSYTLTLDAGDEVADNPTIGGGRVFVYFDDEDQFRNTKTGQPGFGPEDNTNSDVGLTRTIVAELRVD